MPERICGKLTAIIFENPDTGFLIGDFLVPKEGQLTVTGVLPGVRPGDSLELVGRYVLHPTYGRQFTVQSFQDSLPESPDAIYTYLTSGLIEGVGPVMARRITEAFGTQALQILEKDRARYLEIEGIGAKTLEKIHRSYMQGREMRAVMLELGPLGISPALCVRIFRRYGEDSAQIVRNQPYRLAGEVRGIGFLRADQIAAQAHLPKDDPQRIEQALFHLLRQASSAGGHTWLAYEDLVEQACALLSLPLAQIEPVLSELSLSPGICMQVSRHGRRVALEYLDQAETEAASHLVLLSSAPPPIEEALALEGPKDLERLLPGLEPALSHEQAQAVIEAARNSFFVLTGGPGTGKTTTVSAILRLFERFGKKVLLAAPTGKAARRLSEATGQSAATIHRLLEVGYSQEDELPMFAKDEESPIEADALIIDEISMVDAVLFGSLLKAIRPGTALVLVGDEDQLPSVGPGNVLQDLLKSALFASRRLTEVFRQAQESLIIEGAHRIGRGKLPKVNEKQRDVFFIKTASPQETLRVVCALAAERLPRYYSLDPANIQVLSPMRKSAAGTRELNEALQSVLNPPDPEKRQYQGGKILLREGDRVMQIRNNYDKEWTCAQDSGRGVFNGDSGRIAQIDPAAKQFQVVFEDQRKARYEFSEIDQMELSYAATVHKSQGSEYPCVILALSGVPPMLMSRRILYTAFTRARRLLVMVGDPRVLETMVKDRYESVRTTSLADKLAVIGDLQASLP